MLSKDFLLARRLANLYWSGLGSKPGCYLIKWSDLRALAGGAAVGGEKLLAVTDFLLAMGFLLAQHEDGLVIWNRFDIDPRPISERTLNHALVSMADEDEDEIEKGFIETIG